MGVGSIIDPLPTPTASAPAIAASSAAEAPAPAEAAPKKRHRRAVPENDEDHGSSSNETIRGLREEVARAHARIDSLIALLHDKLANPLSKGLDRLSRG